ncbi:UNVERIFIED_CONTAM: hypothetical protein ABIC26_002588 [Paenibacillus sp. PvR008]
MCYELGVKDGHDQSNKHNQFYTEFSETDMLYANTWYKTK